MRHLGTTPGRCNGSQPPLAVTGVTKRPQRGLGRTPVTNLVAHHMATPCAPPQPHSTPRPRWAMGAGPVAHQKPQCGLAGSGWPQGSVTRSQPTDLGPGGTWAAPATAFVMVCFQLFWLFQPRCRLRLKWSEVVSTVEKAFGHLKSSRRWDLDIPRTSFVLPCIGFGTSRVRKVTLQPTRRSSCRGHAASRGSAVARRSAEAGGRVMAHRPKVVPASEDQGP